MPEITTFWPAREGFGDAVIVRPDGPHGAGAQQTPDVAGWGQHVVVQHVVVQHVVVPQQIGWACGWLAGPVTGTGQHGMIIGRCCGQMYGERAAAPAGPATARTTTAATEAAATSSA